MPLSEAHIGRTYPPTAPYEVSRAKIAEFARALGDDNPAYSGPGAIAPPTFAVVLASEAWGALFGDPDLDIALKRVIHGDQSFTWDRPLRAGDEVTATLSVDKVRLRGPLEWVGITVDIATTAGEHVCTAASTLLHNRPQEDQA